MFTEKFDKLTNEAFAAVKEALKTLGGSYTLPNTTCLIINEGNGYTCDLLAKKVLLKGNSVVIFADIGEEREKEILGNDGCSPEEVFFEGSDDYAEWDELIELFDEVIAAAPEDKSKILVCELCGSIRIQTRAWVDANDNQYIDDCCNDDDDNWCDDCEQHAGFCFMSDFEKKMDNWAKENGIAWPEGADYEKKREIYNE